MVSKAGNRSGCERGYIGHRWLIRLGRCHVRDCMVEANLRDWANVSCGLMLVAIWQNRPPSSTMYWSICAVETGVTACGVGSQRWYGVRAMTLA